jgi:RHS repeat-associated protein
LVASYAYNAAGWLETVTDPRGIASRTEYDAKGRVVKEIAAYTNGVVTNNTNKTVRYGYDGSDHLTSLTVDLPGGGVQQTQWVYGVTTAGGNGVTSNDLLREVRHPDPATGLASASEAETVTYNALGQTRTATDRNGTEHTYRYDVLGRLTSDAVTTLGAGVDGAVRRLETAYDTQGNAYLFTSYDAAVGGNVVNQVLRQFNGLGQLTREYQATGGAVNLSTTPKVQYAYSEMSGGANHSRLTSMTYPSGYTVNFHYASGLDDGISRLSSLSDSSGTLESYDYLGLSTVVRRSHPQPGLDLSYIKLAAEAVGDAGDQYTGIDRFGRVDDQRWVDLNGVDVSRQRYGYDRDSNRLYREDVVHAASSEVYTYDQLNQLLSFDRGTLNAAKDGVEGTPTRSQEWALDALGNFTGVTTDGTTETRTHNLQNEVTGVGGATLAFDANGNLTTDQDGRTLVYDAWNRLVVVKDAGNVTVREYAYDALNRKVTETAGGVTREFLYSAAWQVLEERVGGVADTRYVWSPVYVDALVLRDRDTNADGSLDERLWVVQDANYNVVALVDDSGAVVERYEYDAYGQRTVLAPDWSARASSLYDMRVAWQGLRIDEGIGLYQVRERWVSYVLGRAATADPLGLGPDLNMYRWETNNPVAYLDPTGLNTVDLKIKNAIARGDVAEVKAILESIKDAGGAIISAETEAAANAFLARAAAAEAAKASPAAAAAAAAAARRMASKAKDVIAKECKGSIHEEFPAQFYNKTLNEIKKAAQGGDPAAKKAWKLINENRFKKGSK